MHRRNFIKSSGLALAGGLLARNGYAASASGAATTAVVAARPQLSQVFDVAFHHYLVNPDAYKNLYTTYLGVAPKFLPTCAESAWPKVAPGPLDAVLKRGVLRFGYAEGAPYVYHTANGELAGLNWELGNALTAIIRAQYADYAPGKGLRTEWVKIAMPAGADPEADRFNALYTGLKQGLFDIAMSGQANLSAAAASIPAVKEVDWTCATEILFTNILYSGLGNFNARLAKIVGGTREAFITEIKSWPADAIFMCVVNEGPSKTNMEALVKAIGARAKLLYGNVPEITQAINNQTIHFSIGDAVAYSWMAVQPGFKGLNLNIAAAASDPLGTAQPVAAFTMR